MSIAPRRPRLNLLPEHPQDEPLVDKLTAGVRVWLSRGPGVSAWGMAYLRAQRHHRAVVRMLGWNEYYQKFVLTFDDRMEERHMVRLSFAQTGIIRRVEERRASENPKAASDSEDPKAASDSDTAEK